MNKDIKPHSNYLVNEFTCEICGVRTRVYSNRPDKYVRRERCQCCGSPIRMGKSETWKDRLYKTFLRLRRFWEI